MLMVRSLADYWHKKLETLRVDRVMAKKTKVCARKVTYSIVFFSLPFSNFSLHPVTLQP